MADLRVGFVTCVQVGLSCMEEIAAIGGRLHAVLTIPDEKAPAKSGRAYVDAHCRQHGIDLGKFGNVNDADAVQWLRDHHLDWLFIIGWSQIARTEVLEVSTRGAIGIHPTLLPEGRGRAAVPWAILKGLTVTGVSMFKLDTGVDTGPLLAQERIPVEPRDTATALYVKVEAAHRYLVRRTWPQLIADELQLTIQDESRATVWPGRSPADGRLDPLMTVADADRLVRAVTRPYPGAFLETRGELVRIWSAVPADLAPSGSSGELFHFRDGSLLATEIERERA